MPRSHHGFTIFKEDYPELHVIAAGSLLEFTLEELPTFGVGRIHSLFMYPMTFDEFLVANKEEGLISMRNESDGQHPIGTAFHEKLIEYFRIYLLVGGMPESVLAWIKTHDFNRCRNIQEDIVLTYEDDFGKYKSESIPICFAPPCVVFAIKQEKNSHSVPFLKITEVHRSEKPFDC